MVSLASKMPIRATSEPIKAMQLSLCRRRLRASKFIFLSKDFALLRHEDLQAIHAVRHVLRLVLIRLVDECVAFSWSRPLLLCGYWFQRLFISLQPTCWNKLFQCSAILSLSEIIVVLFTQCINFLEAMWALFSAQPFVRTRDAKNPGLTSKSSSFKEFTTKKMGEVFPLENHHRAEINHHGQYVVK